MARATPPNHAPEYHPNLTEQAAITARRASACLPRNGGEQLEGPLWLVSYATASLPPASDYEGSLVYDTTVQAVKFSDGSTWATL